MEVKKIETLLSMNRIWDRCYEFLNIFAKKIGENIGFFAQTTVSFGKNLIITLVLEKNAKIFSQKLLKTQKFMIIASTPSCSRLVLFFGIVVKGKTVAGTRQASEPGS
jgi:hypothetical protein